jgi:hypothetical protein
MLTKAEREAIRQEAEGYQAWTQYRQLLALLADLDVKDAALEPFAVLAPTYEGKKWADNEPLIVRFAEGGNLTLTVGDLRRAAEARGGA